MNSCPQCQFKYQCICNQHPLLTNTKLNLILLTHENELSRKTNTGKLLADIMPNTTQRLIWKRGHIYPEITQLHKKKFQPIFVVYPSSNSQAITEIINKPQKYIKDKNTQEPISPIFIILDGTWQEAKKIWNKTPWLQGLPQVHLTPENQSIYHLRRNQQQSHLCTFEVGAHLIEIIGEIEQAAQVQQFFDYYLKVFQADQSGHQYFSSAL